MIKLKVVSISTETVKPAQREFGFPVALFVPVVKEVTKNGVTTKEISSGRFIFYSEAKKLFNVESAESKITISEAEIGLFVFDSTSVKIPDDYKKGVTKGGILVCSKKNAVRMYTDNGLDINEPWFFKLEECIADLPGKENSRVYLLQPLEKMEKEAA